MSEYKPVQITCFTCNETFVHQSYDELSAAIMSGVYMYMPPNKVICETCYPELKMVEDEYYEAGVAMQEECRQKLTGIMESQRAKVVGSVVRSIH